MSGNDTPNTPDLSETELRAMKVDELRHRARDEGVSGTSSMRKEELVKAVSEQHREGGEASQSRAEEGAGEAGEARGGGGGGSQSRAEEGAGEPGDAGPDSGHVRRGPETSKSLQYSQEITSPEEDPERPGRSLATTNHEVIRSWAEARDAVPATVEGTEH